MEYTFESNVRTTGYLDQFDQDTVKNEPMLFSCDVKHARKLGGPITNNFLDKLSESAWMTDDTILDSRVHMLMPGWYPCIPGYHHDDVPRTRHDAQPNYDNPEYHAQHCMALVNADVSPTQFAIGRITLPEILPGDGPIYKTWHKLVDNAVKNNFLASYSCPDRTLIEFNSHAFHQGVVAKKNGWRWFIRASKLTHRKPTNEIRRQVQAYLPAPMEGW